MKRIMVTGAGGGPALNFTRSLRLAEEPFHLIGVDSNEYYLARAETDESYLVPRANEADYIPVLQALVRETGAEMIFAQPDVEIEVLSERRGELGLRTFWPDPRTVSICQDKFATYRAWREVGLPEPETTMIDGPDDLEAFMREHGDVWLRATHGAAGRGSFHTDSFPQAKAWVEFNGGWGSFSVAEYLSPDSITWQSIWHRGELVVAQTRKRLYWEFADRAPSGITGITGAAITVSDERVDETSLRAIYAVDPEPHGIFSVDMTYDREGVPNPTEINIGRFFTTHLFFTAAGLNMPHIAVQLGFDEQPPAFESKTNPLPDGLAWVRGMDREPVLTTVDELERSLAALRERRGKLVPSNGVRV